MPAFAAVLLLASATLSAAESAALDAATSEVFAPYNDEQMIEAPWERGIWSNEIQHLVSHWQSVVPQDEVDELNDGDWLCQCQDWDAKKFRVTITRRKLVEPGVAEVAVDIELGFGEPRDAFLTFRQEEGHWMLDDLYSEPYPDGIKDALHRTILEDEELQKANR